MVSSLLLLAAVYLHQRWQEERRTEGAFDAEIVAAAATYDLDPALVKAVVWKESRFDPQARGSSGEIGLMQLMDAAAYEWSDSSGIDGFAPEHLLDPGTNTLAGSFYLSRMMRLFSHCDDPLPYALASYNAGRSRTLRWSQGTAATNAVAFIDRIRFPSTRHYVLSVMERQERYLGDF